MGESYHDGWRTPRGGAGRVSVVGICGFWAAEPRLLFPSRSENAIHLCNSSFRAVSESCIFMQPRRNLWTMLAFIERGDSEMPHPSHETFSFSRVPFRCDQYFWRGVKSAEYSFHHLR